MYEDNNTFGNYGQSNNNGFPTSYGNGSYGNGNGSYGQNPYSSQNSYGYGNGQQGYGTYQYSTGNNNQNTTPNEPNGGGKKKRTGTVVLVAAIIIALLAGSVGAGFYAYKNGAFSGTKDYAAADIEEKKEAEENNDSAEEEKSTEATSESTEDNKVKSTTQTGEIKAVVTDVTGVVESVMPAMVIIHNNYTASANYFGYSQKEEAQASGSGIIIGQNDTELLIATNYHVINGADSLEAIFADSDATAATAVVKGTNEDMDLAVIAVMLDDIPSKTRDQIKVATLGDSDSLTLGEPAIAIGNALGYGQSVTTGVVSAINREIEISEGNTQTFIQTDAAINPGNSGGALLNIQGEVIGINSNKIGGNTIEGMGYAIPISVAKPIIEELMNEETKIKYAEDERGYIGISGVTVTNDVSQVYGLPLGIYVAEVSNGGGAEAAGMQKGDVIVGFDGQEVSSMDDLQNKLQYCAAGTTVKVKVMRQEGSEYSEIEMDVTLGKKSK